MTKSIRVALATLFLCGCAFAQAVTSTITGRVTDASEAAIPRVQVRVVNEDSGVVTSAEANELGIYRAASLSPGAYRLETQATGFQKLIRRGVTVQVSQVLEVNLTLQVGSLGQTMDVTATAPVIESQTSSLGQLVERQMIEGMPMPNRAATALIVLAPTAAVQSAATGGENMAIFSVGGGRMRNQQFSLDGGNVNNVVGLAVPQHQVSLPMDAMQEFRVIANNYAAEHGHSTGGIITVATRSGTNRFRGSAFEYLRNEALDARNFFAVRRPKFRQHQFGGTVGGPIRKDKTHFMVSYERTQQVTGATATQTVPSLAQRQGDFSQTLDAARRVITIYDPATTSAGARQPFPNNAIPAGRIDAVAKSIAAYWPEPNQPGTLTGGNNFSLNTRPTFTRDIAVARADHQFSERDQLMARYYINDNRSENPGVYPQRAADSSANNIDSRTQNILGNWTHTFRSTLLNEFRLGYMKRDYFSSRFGRDEDLAGKLGLKGVSKAGFPIIAVTGYQGLGGAPYRFSSPLLDTQLQDSLSWFHGKHALKLGLEGRWGLFTDDTDTSSSGNFSFIQQMTGLPNAANTGNSFATFLLGEVNAANIIRPDPIRSHAAYWAWFVQDDWRVTNSLTLNFGLRWEAEVPRTVDDDRMNSFDMRAANPVSGTPGTVTFAGRNGVARSAYDLDPDNLGPRFGFAYRLPFLSNTLVRGGAGIFYGTTVSNIIGTAATLGFSTDVRLTATETGINSAMRLREGFPPYTRPTVSQLGPGFGAVSLGRPTTTAVTFFERDRKTPASYQVNLNIQHELQGSMLIEVGYVGNQSRHLTANDLSLNQVHPSQFGPGNAQLRRPFPQFTNVALVNPAVGSSSYHAGTVKMERRFSGGLTLLGHYTFSKFIDDVESFSELGATGSYMDFYNRRLDRGLSGSDLRHRAVLSGVYQIPFLKNRGVLSALFGGWRTGVIASMQSGPAFTVLSASNQTNGFLAGGLRADVTGTPSLPGDQRSIDRWFNTAAFRVPDPYRFGSAGRSILNSPGLVNFDTSFIKAFPVRERLRFELRAEFFNFFNQSDFGEPAASVGTPAFGTIRSARPGRSTQVAVRLEF